MSVPKIHARVGRQPGGEADIALRPQVEYRNDERPVIRDPVGQQDLQVQPLRALWARLRACLPDREIPTESEDGG